jgi:hypothetical protein
MIPIGRIAFDETRQTFVIKLDTTNTVCRLDPEYTELFERLIPKKELKHARLNPAKGTTTEP